jgi:hypothetical protein
MVPILSIASWLGGILFMCCGPFASIWMIPVANFLSYFVCGIIFAAIAGIGGFRWARVVSLALSVPAALFGCAGFFGILVLFFGSYEGRPGTPFFLPLCLAVCLVCLLMVSMPVFWMALLRKSTRALANQ